MQYNLKNLPPSIAYYAAQKNQPLNPIQNFVVPDKRAIQRLKRVLAYYEKLPKSEPFNYGTSSNYPKYPEPTPSTEKPIEFNKLDDLPLFKKL